MTAYQWPFRFMIPFCILPGSIFVFATLSPVKKGYGRKQVEVTKRVTRLSMMLRYHAPILADIDIVTRTENPRVGGSIPPLGTNNSRTYVD